ncbi:MAG: hypothetical protein M1569_03165 [Candidatus Marsarchaeota archaeon]|nr:hypothetical protein [Candidatus Marsarchaeota archaeon]MCL5413375.1 hypothetical protein [Candidatus Marsarchaeota archaeon]
MPKLTLTIELDNPKDYFEILDGERFSNSRVSIKPEGSLLKVRIDADSPKALMSIAGSIIKQIRIIDQTSDLVG